MRRSQTASFKQTSQIGCHPRICCRDGVTKPEMPTVWRRTFLTIYSRWANVSWELGPWPAHFGRRHFSFVTDSAVEVFVIEMRTQFFTTLAAQLSRYKSFREWILFVVCARVVCNAVASRTKTNRTDVTKNVSPGCRQHQRDTNTCCTYVAKAASIQ